MKIPNVLEPKLKWGIAGCGRFAENRVIPAIKLLKFSRINSLYSSSLSRAKDLSQSFSIKQYYSDFNEFLESDITAVYIASANKDHYSQVIAAAAAGKQIICEKPLAMTSGEAKEMVEVCKKYNVLLSIGYVQRFHPLCMKAKEIIDSGMLGKVININISHSINFPPDKNFRFKKEESGGGALRDVGTHCIDLLRYFGGEISDIRGFTDNVIYQSEVEDFATANVKFENGSYGSFYAAYCIKKPLNRIEIIGYNGNVVIEGLIGRLLNYPKLSISINSQVKKAFRKGGNPLLFLIKDFKHAILKGGTPLVTGTDGYKNLLLIEELEKNCN